MYNLTLQKFQTQETVLKFMNIAKHIKEYQTKLNVNNHVFVKMEDFVIVSIIKVF